jgi:VWFA-related protein
LFCSFWLICGLTAADDNAPVFRSDVAMGRIDALVVDHARRPIGGLHTDDFQLRQGATPIPIHNLAYEDLPVDVLLLLDVSGSMRVHIQTISAAAHQALAALGHQDRVGIMVFDTRTRLQLPFRQDPGQVERKLDDVVETEPFNGGTNINTALINAAAYVEHEGRRQMRHAIVIVTDDQALPCDQARVLAALDRADAVLMVLLAPTVTYSTGPYQGRTRRNPPAISPWPGGAGQLGGIILRRHPGTPGPGSPPGRISYPSVTWAGSTTIARASGGDTLPVNNARAVETTFERIRRRYALYFYMPDGVQPGRGLDLNLTDAARRRYPDAGMQYRQVALGQVASGQEGPRQGLITRVPAHPPGGYPSEPAVSDSTRDERAIRRRGISDPSSSPRVMIEPAQ